MGAYILLSREHRKGNAVNSITNGWANMQHIHERGHNVFALSDEKVFKDSTKAKLLNIKAAYFFNVIENG